MKLPAAGRVVNEFLLDEYGIIGGYDLGQDYPALEESYAGLRDRDEQPDRDRDSGRGAGRRSPSMNRGRYDGDEEVAR